MPDSSLFQTLATIRDMGNLSINLLLCLLGAALALGAVFLGRRAIKRWKWIGYPHALVCVDGAAVAIASCVVGGLDLLKSATFYSIQAYSLAGYAVFGFITTTAIGTKWLMSQAKEISATRYQEVVEAGLKAAKDRDRALSAEALVCEVMKQKLNRLVAWRRGGSVGGLIDALDPGRQIHVLIQVLHDYLARDRAVGKRLRIAIYMPSEDELFLDPAYSWDGAKVNCFTHQKENRDYMKISNPGGARSVVVDCWLAPADQPFKFICDTEIELPKKRFRYFRNEQEKTLRSMVAFRHVMELSPSDAFVVTLDSDQPGFFSADIEAECRLLLPAFSRRIELELLALPIVNNPQQT